MEIFNEYEEKFKKYMDEEESLVKCYKISGNILAHTLRKYIKDIVNPQYQVSVVNSYIKGCKIEWDLLILKNTVSEDEINYNIYYPENVVCALEFKTSGAVFKKDCKESVDYIKKYLNILKQINIRQINTNIKYGYISLCEIPTNLLAMKEEYPDNCFWLIEGYYGSRNNPEIIKNSKEEFKEYLKKLINNE